MIEIADKTVLHLPRLTRFVKDGIYFVLDGEGPNWIATDQSGAGMLDLIDGQRPFGEIVREYSVLQSIETAKAWMHVHTLAHELLRRNLISTTPFQRLAYTGRVDYLKPVRLREFWIHTNNSCNLTCTHCLVESHPGGDPGISTEKLKNSIDQAAELGAHRFYFTGGEPFVRNDIFDLMEYVTNEKKAELIILTNATLFRGDRLEGLRRQDRKRLKFQVSLDGCRPETNDPIRGKGTFGQIGEGLKILSSLGFETSLTAVVTGTNIKDMADLPDLAHAHGAKSIHLMWLHRRGRALEAFSGLFPSNEELLTLVRKIKRRSDQLGLTFDNMESLKLRVNGQPGVKFDLGNSCWDSLCLYSNGHLYPSAAFAGYAPLDIGDATEHSLKALWLESPVTRQFRAASLVRKAGIKNEPFRFITGGGDIEHSFFYSEGEKGTGTILGEDPYYSLYLDMIKDVMFDLAREKRALVNTRSGFSVPPVYHAMGEGGIVCGTKEELVSEEEVSTLHSNCVLSFDVEKPHKIVQDFYGEAAEQPQADLCCPVNYDVSDTSHIPAEVLERFYGCGSPMAMAGVREGEVVVDLGSGGGIDCFIAARLTGPKGRVIGVDMTDPMLEVANRNRKPVADNLGFDIVEFRKGYLEKIPVEDLSVDLLTSNCVINLSPDKKAVFREMWRVLKNHGRILISDIVTEVPIPPKIRVNEQLWGECLSGALTEEEFMAELERAGFYGLAQIKKTFWKEVEGYTFYSVSLRGYKFEKTEGCRFTGGKAVYRGPFKAVVDEEGHIFPRDEAVEVCTDTASKLANPPYADQFTIIQPGHKPENKMVETAEAVVSSPAGSPKKQNDAEACGPGCC